MASVNKVFESASRSSLGERVTFTMKGRDFEALPDAPGQAMLDAALASKLDEIGQIEATMTFLDEVLEPDSRQRFADALKASVDPITIQDAAELVGWLLTEVYGGGAPKAESSPSATGVSTTGGNSTAPTPAMA